ncbi:hypothetical protein EBQ24_05660 [Allofranklinella schreckenbergeri]|uniref:Uncharacterized protein n=1 Tax=Allofranklinella schreckenbergeri TaxID=1076744 RepID=A0A3M6R4Z1_9BURK|nr:hypothetical protein EBQ24_05660 [Allofranklinella schreckenbergeri]
MLCRLLPLLIDTRQLPAAWRRFIMRTGQYASIILLTVILLNILKDMDTLENHHELWLGAAVAGLLTASGLKTHWAFMAGIGVYIVSGTIF